MSHSVDEIDRKILEALQIDSRQSIADIADSVGLSKSACHRRVKLLEEHGIIDRYTAVLNAAALGYSLTFVVDVTLRAQTDDVMTAFENSVRRLPQVLECQLMTGRDDYILRVVAQSAEDYEATHHRIARLPGVETIQSSLSLRTVKAWTGLPVRQP